MASYGLTGARAQRLRALTGALRALTGALRAQLLRAQLFTGLRAHLTGASPNVKYTVMFLRALTGAVFCGFFTGALYGLTGAPYGRLRALTGAKVYFTGAYGRLRASTGAYGRLRAQISYGLTGALTDPSSRPDWRGSQTEFLFSVTRFSNANPGNFAWICMSKMEFLWEFPGSGPPGSLKTEFLF